MPQFEELEVGQVIATSEFSVNRDSLVRYAGASGDFNPIHYRDDVAQSVGLPGVLAHGMLTMGMAVQPVVTWLGDSAKVLEYGVRFTKPVLVAANEPSLVTVTATVAVLNPVEKQARIDLTTTFQDLTVLGKAQVLVQL